MTFREKQAMEMGRDALSMLGQRFRDVREKQGLTPAESFAECETERIAYARMCLIVEEAKDDE